MPNQKKKPTTKKHASPAERKPTLSPLQKKLLLGAIILIVLAIAGKIGFDILYDRYEGGPAYRAAKQRCGGEPVAGIKVIKTGEKYYLLPSDSRYDNYIPMPKAAYFCNEDEAIDSGYQHDQF